MSPWLLPVELYVDWLAPPTERVYHNLLFDYLTEISGADLYYEHRLPSGGRPDVIAAVDGRLIVYEVKAETANRHALDQLARYMVEIGDMFPRARVEGVIAAPSFRTYLEDQAFAWLMPITLVRM